MNNTHFVAAAAIVAVTITFSHVMQFVDVYTSCAWSSFKLRIVLYNEKREEVEK